MADAEPDRDASHDANVDAAADTDAGEDLPEVAARWERIDLAFGIAEPYVTRALASDADYLYVVVNVEDTPSKSWNILRSRDSGDSWDLVHEMSARAADRPSFFGDLDGVLALVVPAFSEAALLLSDDQGTSWREVANVPAPLNRAAAREGEVILVTGTSSHRTPDGGSTWDPLQPPPTPHIRATRFANQWWAIDAFGGLQNLVGAQTNWNDVSAPAASDLFLHDDRLWLKGVDGALAHSDDGNVWNEVPTPAGDEYGEVYRSPNGAIWLLAHENPTVLYSTIDRGATLADITFDYPRDAEGRLCLARFIATDTHAIAATQGGLFDAPGCTPGADPDGGVYRYALSLEP